MKMRHILLTVLLVALLGVIFGAPRFTEKFWPAFRQQEAEQKLGLRVESVWVSSHELSSKCPSVGGRCVNVKPGERGTIIEVRAVKPKWGYFVVVRWDTPREDGTPLYSYLGKYSFRTHVRQVS
jgi:hypothetical protein